MIVIHQRMCERGTTKETSRIKTQKVIDIRRIALALEKGLSIVTGDKDNSFVAQAFGVELYGNYIISSIPLLSYPIISLFIALSLLSL